ncbi:MAG: adenylosuccinate synthase [Actinomycetes bacterium]|nr:adenylosuccinate synthase [Actinomycetes bacterium]
MAAVVLVGTQWGDEGKGKITDLLSQDFDYVVRFQGGNNAGHTVIHDGHTLKLHLIPSGVMYESVTPVIGNGCVIDPKVLLAEIDAVQSEGISCERLTISSNAHLIMPYHRDLDGASERRLGAQEIGTTRRGIGPAYQDKATRLGLRTQDLFDRSIFREKVAAALTEKNDILDKIYGLPTYTVDQLADEYLAYAEILNPYVADTAPLLNDALDAGQWVFFEGAQGTLLDLDHGTYPFVTSSNPTAGGACVGTGVGPARIDRVLGIAKAYITRVGSGPFPTELDTDDADGDTFIRVGHEYGTTTGRRRRPGWYDAPVVRYAVQVNGLTDLAITKLDVLSAFDEIKVCVAYEHLGQTYTSVPGHQSAFHHARPIYETLPGWKTDISACRDFNDLPPAARDYIAYLEELAGVPVSLIAVGPQREQTIIRNWERR